MEIRGMRGDQPKASVPVKVRKMSSELQLAMTRGMLEEDSDGKIYLSVMAKRAIAVVEDDDVFMEAIRERAIDEEDALLGFFTIVYMACYPEAASSEIQSVVNALLGWNRGAKETRLDEWSMKLRFRLE
jgi:hypothetical protein